MLTWPDPVVLLPALRLRCPHLDCEEAGKHHWKHDGVPQAHEVRA
jgi:hypothetical protein